MAFRAVFTMLEIFEIYISFDRVIVFTYYFAESFNWYSLLLPKHSCTPLSDHSLFIAANNSSLKGSVSSILWITSNTIFASVCKHETTKNFKFLHLRKNIPIMLNHKICFISGFDSCQIILRVLNNNIRIYNIIM